MRSFARQALCALAALCLPTAALAQVEDQASETLGDSAQQQSSGPNAEFVPYIEAMQVFSAELEPGNDTVTYSIAAVGFDASVTGHVRLDTPLVGAVAQLATAVARPAVERAVERKVRRFFGTVARVSRWAYDEPEQMWAAIEGHPEVPQDATLAAFRQILLADRPPAWLDDGFRLLPVEEARREAAEAGATSP